MTKLKPFREIRRESLADCHVFRVERSVAESPVDGSENEYFRVVCPDWVQIIPITADDEVVLIRQYRHGASGFVLEIPGGMVDQGEAPADAAIRECLEETGYRADLVQSLGSINPNPAFHDHRLHSFYARGVVKVADAEVSASEVTEVELVPLDRLSGMLLAGELDHSLVVATLWRFLFEHA